MKKTLLLVFFLSLSISVYGAQKKDLRLEGVMANPRSPKELVALINGNMVKAGDVCEGYTVKEIGPDYAVLERSPGGRLIRLGLVAIEDPVSKKTGMDVKKGDSEKPKEGFGGIFGMALETKAMAEMRQLFTGASILLSRESYDSQGKAVPPDFNLQKMAEQGLIPKCLAGGRSGQYVYTIESRGMAFEIRGDPADPNSPLKHFIIDSDGTLRVEQ